MENIQQEEEEVGQRVPKSKPTKTMSLIINTRFLNQNIYTTFLQKRFGECIRLIQRSGCKDEFKLYIMSIIQKSCYHLDKSLDLLNQCHIMDKNNYSYLKTISKNYFLLGKYKSSLEVAKEAHRINSSDYQIFYILGKISLALGDEKGAQEYFKTSQGKEPNQQSFIQQAKICMNSREYIQAIDYLNQCVGISPQNPQAFEMLGLCYSQMGRNDDAYKAYNLALEVDAEKYISLVGKGSIEMERKNLQEAMNSFTKAYKTSSNSAVLWNNIGMIMVEKGKLVAGYCCFKRALFLDPFRWNFHANLALLFFRKQKFLPCKIHLQSALKLNKDPSLFNLLGVCLLELKDYSNAQKSFNEALKMQANFVDAKFNLMQCLVQKGEKEKGLVIFKELQMQKSVDLLQDRLLSLKNKYFD